MMVKFFILFFTNPNKTNKHFNQLRKIIHFLYPHWTHSSLRVNLYSRTVKNTYARTTLHGRQRNVFLVLVLGERCRHKRRWSVHSTHLSQFFSYLFLSHLEFSMFADNPCTGHSVLVLWMRGPPRETEPCCHHLPALAHRRYHALHCRRPVHCDVCRGSAVQFR